jgi:hypothetical protein
LLALLLALAACKSPNIEFEARKAAADAKAVKLLQEEYGLPAPPPLRLEVSKAGPAAPGVFRLVVEEPGWSLDLPLERRRVEPVYSPAQTAFTWELPAGRVKNNMDAGGGPTPLLLDLSKGGEHRALVAPCVATKWLASEWAATAVSVGFLALVWPITLAAAGASQVGIDADIRRTYGEEHVRTMLETQPGPAAPACFPGDGHYGARLETDPQGQSILLITLQGGSARTGPGTGLEEMRRAIAWYQPELAELVAEHPTQPGTFTIPLQRGSSSAPRPILLLSTGEGAEPSPRELWVFYYSTSGSWAKAWRLYPRARA